MSKKVLYVLAASSMLFATGCWGTVHTVLYHLSDVTQWAAALRILGAKTLT